MRKLLIVVIYFISLNSFALDRYTISNLVKQLKPAVVTITNKSKGFMQESTVASGVVVSSDGFIVTNQHAVDNNKEVTIKFSDNKTYTAKVVSFDKRTDLAILKIQDYNAFPFVYFGNSEQVQVGELVFAIGSPYGLENSVSMGIISGKNRNMGDKYSDFLQTDAVINPGNSGGPLFSLSGQLIGINTSALMPNGANSGIGFAIPSNLVSRIITDLKSKGKVVRSSLGMNVTDITASLKKQLNLSVNNGAIIYDINKNSPVIEKGIRIGDTVIQYNGQYISNSADLHKMIKNSRIGQVIRLKFIRNNKVYGSNVKIIREN